MRSTAQGKTTVKGILAGILVVMLGCCTQPDTETAVAPEPSAESLSDDEVKEIVHATMARIHADLQDLRSRFPQLSAIDTAEVSPDRFSYRSGLLGSRPLEMTFKKDGCDVAVWTMYPAKPGDKEEQPLVGSPYLRLANGKYLVVGRFALAEQTSQGKEFMREAHEVISKEISAMLARLGHRRGDSLEHLPDDP